MNIIDILDENRIRCQTRANSKKRALEILSELLATDSEGVEQVAVFDTLLNREKLGSTGLGFGAAVPHGRFEHIKKPIAATVTLETPVNFDAIDSQPVDLLVALLVPEDSSDDHIKLLAQLAEAFSTENFRQNLRKARDPKSVLKLFVLNITQHKAA
ncbi:MAG: PTS IIA-like nitrogen regulatory protein PtsN [Gammaproteobacteria bacterium]|nr:MAG: PTS IIA-like nitrogen regulatory protein PtsN [Gammaproteobacteria bacterium]